MRCSHRCIRWSILLITSSLPSSRSLSWSHLGQFRARELVKRRHSASVRSFSQVPKRSLKLGRNSFTSCRQNRHRVLCEKANLIGIGDGELNDVILRGAYFGFWAAAARSLA